MEAGYLVCFASIVSDATVVVYNGVPIAAFAAAAAFAVTVAVFAAAFSVSAESASADALAVSAAIVAVFANTFCCCYHRSYFC